MEAREPTPPPQAETTTELRLEEVVLVEGMHPFDAGTYHVE
jgi:hypothetical protein